MSSLKLSHPTSFKTRELPVKSGLDTQSKAAHQIDNKILALQSELSEAVAADKVSLNQFADSVGDLETLSRATAKFRPDGFSTDERKQLNSAFANVGKSEGKKIDPSIKALYQQVQAGKIKAEDLTEELNWRSQRAYGSVLAERPGPVFQEERHKLRAHLYVARSSQAQAPAPDYTHPKFSELVQKAIDLFPTLDSNKDQVVDRTEARKLVTDYKSLGLTPAQAVTLYSRQKHLASALEPSKKHEKLKLEALESLLAENYPKQPSKELRELVTQVSTRLRAQEALKDSEPSPFKMSEEFQANRVSQGKEGSCWLLCNLPTLTELELGQIIRAEGDGYRVELADGRSTQVTPLNEVERRLYSKGDGSWSGLLEKGVSQILAETGADINGGQASIGRKLLTGQNSVEHRFMEAPKVEGSADLRDRDLLFTTMQRALDSGSALFCSTLSIDFDEDISEISASQHAYTVLAVDRESDSVMVRNPWGHNEQADLDGQNDGVFQLTQDQFFANYSRVYMDKTAS